MSETPKPTPSRTHERTSQRGRGKRLTHEERELAQKTFLRQFAYLGNMMASCRTANIDRKTIYEWLEKDETFSLKYRQAELDAADVIRAEMFRRAIQGVEEPVVSQGKVVRDDQGKPLMVRKYSDQLLTTLAKSRMPEFRERTHVEMSGQMTVQNDHSFSDDPEAAALARSLLFRLGTSGSPRNSGGSGMAGE